MYIVNNDEIMRGVKNGLGIILTRDESHLLSAHMDKNGDHRVNYEEFSSKINLKDY